MVTTFNATQEDRLRFAGAKVFRCGAINIWKQEGPSSAVPVAKDTRIFNNSSCLESETIA